jgi:alpha-ribazole phosphatase
MGEERMSTTRIDLLRHGLPEGDNCFRGQVDFPLTEQGMRQMFASAGTCSSYDLVITSPLSRCRDFAVKFASQQGIPLIEDSGFMELDFGEWDGVPKQQVWDKESERLSAFWSEPWLTAPPGGESLEDYDQRTAKAWKAMLEQNRGKSILLVTHGGVIKQTIRHLLELPKSALYIQRLEIPYAARVSVSVYHDDNGVLWPRLHWPGTD